MPTLSVKYDTEQIEAAIEHAMAAVPGQIKRIRYSTGEDWVHEPALFFRILLADPNRRFEDLSSKSPAIRKEFFDLCNGTVDRLDNELFSDQYFIYPEFRTVAEQEILRSPEWE